MKNSFDFIFILQTNFKIVRFTLQIIIIFTVINLNGQTYYAKEPEFTEYNLCANVIGLCHPETKHNSNFIYDKQLYHFRCDTLAHVKFWRQVMTLTKDSVVLCFNHNRLIIDKMNTEHWFGRSEAFKKSYRDSVRAKHNVDSTIRVLATAGKSYFYDFNKAYANFDRGINNFVANGVDPWYAQAILLIESPNKLQKSNVGAYGSFQLMKDVARLFGLKVNKQIDERADFDRSAYAASSLLKTVCIPKTKQILDSLNIKYKEHDLWFRLLVMHSYHAGAGNVKKALYSFMPKNGGMEVIYTLWRTEAGQFRAASQNYSQLVLAAMIEMNERVSKNMIPSPPQAVKTNKLDN